ncbi:hypothetical protein HanPI659440_Chr05g0195731 [Helianthus annuus]|nr:hypothetical protein HanPI659440_Chr05g0195731 [Helianthus annuus]
MLFCFEQLFVSSRCFRHRLGCDMWRVFSSGGGCLEVRDDDFERLFTVPTNCSDLEVE